MPLRQLFRESWSRLSRAQSTSALWFSARAKPRPSARRAGGGGMSRADLPRPWVCGGPKQQSSRPLGLYGRRLACLNRTCPVHVRCWAPRRAPPNRDPGAQTETHARKPRPRRANRAPGAVDLKSRKSKIQTETQFRRA